MTRPDATTITPLAGRHVPVCGAQCLSNRCTGPCGRLPGHDADEHGHICDGCASAIAGWF